MAVDGIDFDVRVGECSGLLGAGETTTMKVIYGLAEVDAGRLEVPASRRV